MQRVGHFASAEKEIIKEGTSRLQEVGFSLKGSSLKIAELFRFRFTGSYQYPLWCHWRVRTGLARFIKIGRS